MKNTWITAKGSKIEMTTKAITEKIISVDGIEVKKACDEIKIESILVNGEKFENCLHLNAENNIQYSECTIKGVKHPMMVHVPEDVVETVWGEYNRRIAAQNKAYFEAEAKYQAHVKVVYKMMNE